MHGRLKIGRHNRIVYPSYEIQQMQMVDVIKHKNSYFQNADEAKRSSVSSLESNYSVLFLNNSIVSLMTKIGISCVIYSEFFAMWILF